MARTVKNAAERTIVDLVALNGAVIAVAIARVRRGRSALACVNAKLSRSAESKPLPQSPSSASTISCDHCASFSS